MNSVQLHLALTHVPVILSLVGLTILIVSFIKKNTSLTKTSYMIMLVAGIAAIPVYFSGEETEHAVENLPGVSEALIESHEEIAKLAMISISITGILALSALFILRRKLFAKILKTSILIMALISGGLLIQTAHLGGQIRHTEIRNGYTQQNNAEPNNGILPKSIDEKK